MIDDLDQGRVMFGVKRKGFESFPKKTVNKNYFKKRKNGGKHERLKRHGKCH